MQNQTMRGKKKKNKSESNTQGLFFSINNSFWRIGEAVKLDIPKEHRLQRRMTRNNEEILPPNSLPS